MSPIQFTSPEVAIICGPQMPPSDSWFDRTAFDRGLTHGEAFPADPPPFNPDSGDAVDEYVRRQYYDLPLCLYIQYHRTGDERFLTYARKVADSWWRFFQIKEGRVEPSEAPAPRNVSLSGQMLRALDGKPERWRWITAYVREHLFVWCERPLSWFRPLSDGMIAGAEAEPGKQPFMHGTYEGVRDPGYMLLYAAYLARVHPDQGIREEFKSKLLDISVNYYARFQRLQFGDGGIYFEVPESFGLVGLTTQPFQEGLLAEALIQVFEVTHDDTVARTIIRLADHLFNRAYRKDGWRAMYYFLEGKFKDGPDCHTGCGNAANPWPPSDPNFVTEARQLNCTAIHTLAYAYYLSRDPKYLEWWRETFDATYGCSDGFGCAMAAREKEYCEAMRSAGKGLAYVEWAETLPQPELVPTNLPERPIPPTHGPAGTTLYAGGRVTRGGSPVQGQKVVLYDRGGADALGSTLTDAQGAYRFEVNPDQKGVVRVEGSGFSPAGHPFTATATMSTLDFAGEVTTPTPVPTPPEYVSKKLPKESERERTRLYQQMFSEGYAAWQELSGPNIKFKRFRGI